MRMLAASVLIMGLPLAACGEGSSFDKSFKESFRTKFVENCASTAKSSAPAAATAAIDFDRICGCTADRLMKDRSATDLAQLSEPDQRAALDACVSEIYPKGLPVTG